VSNKDLPECHPIRQVHAQDADSRSPGCRAADEDCSLPFEVPAPALSARVEEPRPLPCHWINPCQIRPLAKIAFVARQGESAGVIRSAVLAGQYVLDVIRPEWFVVLVQATVLTAAAGSPPDQVARRGLHRQVLSLAAFPKSARALACRSATTLPAHIYISYSDRSSWERVPSLHFSANTATRASASGSARRLKSERAASTLSERVTGSRSRSRTGVANARCMP
jgi:hypothetical protein